MDDRLKLSCVRGYAAFFRSEKQYELNNSRIIDEWIAINHLISSEVDFIETILTFTSTVKVLQSKKAYINQKFRNMFPDKIAEITPELTYQRLEKALKVNDISIDLEEMLNQYRLQGICVDLCNELFESRE